uniref:Putative nucleic acid binding protein n=1 Tax=uncultured marine group II/III euryarchaeote KM3_33_F08 TaxID=1456435 RepID=A0A075H2Y1_9EURY|nr:putative nucleic acid binding protein [uncultured marine group II/III euryarchaeote KM3_33_F08]
MRVLDTAALLHLPLPELDGFVADSQRDEIERLSPERAFALIATKLVWQPPTPDSLIRAREVAVETGDIAGLSPVDLDLLALAIELDAILVTDDYRLQNCCTAAGLKCEPVLTDGIQAKWTWYLKCVGCGAEHEGHSASQAKGDYGDCDLCGSPLKMRKK